MKDQRYNLACGLSLFVLVIGCTTVSDEGKAWQPPERIDDQDKVEASFGVALDADSRGLVVWSDNTLLGRIFSRSHTQEGGWSAKSEVHFTSEDAFWPVLAMDANGNAVTVWGQESRESGRDSIWSSRYTPGGGWEGAVRLDSEDDGDATKRHVAMDPSGSAIAVWQQSDGTRENIWANRSTLDDDWGTAELIETNDRGHASDPRVAVDVDGNAVAVWHQEDGARVNIWFNRYTPSGRWSIARPVEENDEGEARLPDVAMGPDGSAAVVWQQSDGSHFDIWANHFTPNGGWDTPKRIDDDHSGDATDPRVGVDAEGVAIAVWKQFDGTTDEIWSNRYVPSDGWGAPERLEGNDDGDALRPRIAVSANGEAVAVWPESDGARYDVWAKAYTPLKGWAISERVDPSDQGLGEPVKAEVAIDPHGNAMAVWLRRDPADQTALLGASQLWAARFE